MPPQIGVSEFRKEVSGYRFPAIGSLRTNVRMHPHLASRTFPAGHGAFQIGFEERILLMLETHVSVVPSPAAPLYQWMTVVDDTRGADRKR